MLKKGKRNKDFDVSRFFLFSVWSDKSDTEKALSEEVLAHSAFFNFISKDSRKILGMILFLAFFTRKIVGESFLLLSNSLNIKEVNEKY